MYNSSVSDAYTRDMVMRIFCRACAIPAAAASLLFASKLVPWMRAALDGSHGAEALPRIVHIVHALMTSTALHTRRKVS